MKDRKWRTLVRVVDLDREQDTLTVILPGWNPHQEVSVKLSEVPQAISLSMEPRFRCHAAVNTGAEHAEDLVFTDWEVP